jgi:5-methylcytosine-specific restriction endonuclease McrA
METWTDHLGVVRRVPQARGRIKFTKSIGYEALRAFVLLRDGHRCRHCGSRDALEIDHVVSRRNGGSHHPNNLQCLCSPCNARKSVLVDRKGAQP